MTPDAWRQSAALTLDDLAERLGVIGANPARTVQHWLSGEREPPLRIVAILESASGGAVTVADWPSTTAPLDGDVLDRADDLLSAREPPRAEGIAGPSGHDPESVRAWIASLCAELDITPSALARDAGLAASTLNRFLRNKGQDNLTATTIDALLGAASKIGLKRAGIVDDAASNRVITDAPTDRSPENLRAWVRQLCAHLFVSPTNLAKEAGLGHTTLTRFLDEDWPGNLSSATIGAVLQAACRLAINAPPPARALTIPSTSLDQRETTVRRAEQPHTIEIRQGDAVIRVLDFFVDDLVAALQRARCA